MKKCLFTCVLIIMISVSMKHSVFAADDYYKQLNDRQKSLYQMMYDKFVIDLELEFTISVNQVYERIPLVRVAGSYRNDVYLAYSALVNDNPDFFWGRQLQFSYTGGDLLMDQILQSSKISDCKIRIIQDKTYNYKYQKLYDKAMIKAIRTINKKTKNTKSKYKKLCAIHDYVCKKTQYDFKHGGIMKVKYAYLHNAYGAFVKNKAVCDGYSFAMKALCDFYNIPCLVIYGKAKNDYGAYEKHVWNAVKLNKKWYMLDCTWNDSTKSKKWFLCGKKQMSKTHIMIPKDSNVLYFNYFTYPKISKKNYKK